MQLRIPFTSIVETLKEACQRQLQIDRENANKPRKPRAKKRRTSHDSEVARLRALVREKDRELREIDRELGKKDQELREIDRELGKKDRELRRLRREANIE